MPDEKAKPEKTPAKKPAKKTAPKKRKKSRTAYGAGKLRAAKEIRVLSEELVELRTAESKFPVLKGVFSREVVRCKAGIRSRLERA